MMKIWSRTEGWTYDLLGETIEEVENLLIDLVEKKDAEMVGSYQVTLKAHGGYSKDKEKGYSIKVDFKGPLRLVPSLFQMRRVI